MWSFLLLLILLALHMSVSLSLVCTAGKDMLMFRLANARRGKIKDLEVQVWKFLFAAAI